MRRFINLLFLVGILPLVLLTSCKDDDALSENSEFEILSKYMAQNDLDLPDVLSGWVTSGTGLTVDPVDFSVSDYYIIDLRGASDFDAGHIKDAHNTTLPNVLNEAANANGQPILAVCYTGQTAARAVGALRLMGYNAKSLKWGMSAWHSDFDKWTPNATDFNSPNWVRSGEPPVRQTFSQPTVVTNKSTGQEILEARVQYALNKSGWGLDKTDVLGTPSNYFIINKWPIESWDAYGHINGAFRLDESLILEGMKYVDPNKPAVVYCYTGQTSAISAMWMDVLGYDVKSLMFGVNGINHSELVVGQAGSAPAKSWKGPGSGSELNFGYYDSAGTLHSPEN